LLDVLLGLTLELLFDGCGIAFMFCTSLRLSSEYSASAKLGPSSKEGVMKLDWRDDDDEVWRRVSHPRPLQPRPRALQERGGGTRYLDLHLFGQIWRRRVFSG
jgi:hypothetical protein